MPDAERVVIVTGGAKGIGAAICRAFARLGCRVVVADVDEAAANETAVRLIETGSGGLPVWVDVADTNSVDAMLHQALTVYGRIDVLVNNAGICPLTAFEDIDESEWERVMAINLKGAFLCSQGVIKHMKERRYGRIINISSVAAKMGGVMVGAHYAASKAGLLALTWCLARRYAADGITVNAIAPATIETEMTCGWTVDKRETLLKSIPIGRLGMPDDVAAAAVFLASDAASFITGEVLDVNGGFLMD